MPNKQAEGFMKRLPAQTNTPLPMPPFAERLQEGERLLWEGRPDLRQFTRPKAAAIWILSLPLIPLLVLLEDWKTSGAMPMTSPISWTIAAGAWVIGSWFSTGQTRAQARTAAYALTSRRIFIRRLERLTSQDWRPRIDEIPLGAVQPRLRFLGSDLGTITLGAPIWNYERALRGIPNAAAVFALLTEAQAALPLPEAGGQQPSGPYYAQAKPQARPETAWKLEDMLRRGETILWEGSMNIARLERVERVGLIALVVLASAAGGTVLVLNGWWTPIWQALILVAVAAISYPLARMSYARTARKSRYALTSRRVLVISNAAGKTPKVEDRELPETKTMRLARGRNGFGTVIFEKKTRIVGHTVETYEFSFKHIVDAEAVLAQIVAARQSYFAASAPKPSAPSSLALQDGAQPG